MDRFDVTRNSSILLYGAGIYGREIYKGLISAGYRVAGLIDKDIKGCDWADCPVYGIDDLPSISGDNVVIITLQDASGHDSIAKLIYRSVTDKIVFIPFFSQMNSVCRQELRRAYNCLFHGEYDYLTDIPRYVVNECSLEIIDSYLDHIVFWCPADSLLSPDKEFIIRKFVIAEDIHDDMILCNYGRKISEFEQYYDLFRWEKGLVDHPDKYLHDRRILGGIRDEDAYLANRRRLIEVFRYMIKYDPSFFISSPVDCTLNDNGDAFYAMDGMHRACYLVFNGYDKIPVMTDLNDFRSFEKGRS